VCSSSDKRDLVLPRSGGNAPSACPLLHSLRSANHQNYQEHDSPDTERPNSFQSWAAVVRAEERFDANRSSAFKPRRRSANDTRSGVQPRSHAARLLCPRLPSSILSFSSIDILRLSSICYQTKLDFQFSLRPNITFRLTGYLFCLCITLIPTIWYH
jgi:hypothetical protein